MFDIWFIYFTKRALSSYFLLNLSKLLSADISQRYIFSAFRTKKLVYFYYSDPRDVSEAQQGI